MPNFQIKSKLRDLASKRNIYSFLLGASLVVSYAPFSLWWLPFLVLPLWLAQLIGQSTKSSTQSGFFFALGWFSSGISWVHVSIDQFGGLPLVVSILLMLLLCMYLAIYPAIACYISTKVPKHKSLGIVLLPSIWIYTEYLRANLLTGFPWLSLGYTQLSGPLKSLIPVIGEIGITFLVLLISVLILFIVKNRNRSIAIITIAFIGAISLFASKQVWIKPSEQSIKVALIQGNIAQSLKFSPDQQWPTMLKYLDNSRVNYDADLIIWPESAIPAFESLILTQEFLDMADKSALLNKSAIITGIINYDFKSDQYFNSLIVLGQKHKSKKNTGYYYNHGNRYYKNHLLPIGEFVPFEDILRPIAPLFNLPMSSFSRGDYVQHNLVAQDLKILPLICFEVAFPDQLASNFESDTQLLLTVSNDTWFGDSHGPHQHLEIASMRALEFGRPMLRATNNGVTAVIDHQGNVVKKLPQFKEAVLKTDVTLVNGKTPYSQIWPLIQWFLPMSSIMLIYLISFVLVRRAKTV